MYISILPFFKELHSGKKVVDTLAKTALLSTNSFIYYSILIKHRKSPYLRTNVVCSKEGLKYNNNLGGRGGNTKGEGKNMSTIQKRAIFNYRSVSTYLSLILFYKAIIILDQLLMSY